MFSFLLQCKLLLSWSVVRSDRSFFLLLFCSALVLVRRPLLLLIADAVAGFGGHDSGVAAIDAGLNADLVFVTAIGTGGGAHTRGGVPAAKSRGAPKVRSPD